MYIVQQSITATSSGVYYIKISSNNTYLPCDAEYDRLLRSTIFIKPIFSQHFHFNLGLFLICSYFSGDLSLTVLTD